jgi:phosphatidylserine decarboxylase
MLTRLTMLVTNLIWTEGPFLLVIGVMVASIAYYVNPVLFSISLSVLVFMFYFFRNPDRVCKEALHDACIIVCPADGKIIDVQQSPQGDFEGFDQKVSIFLSPFDVHVNWIPMTGDIEQITYKPGIFMMAFRPKSSELNERNDIVIADSRGHRLLVRQIAGALARRIVCWVRPREYVKAGKKYGMIRFGSRIDILLPKTAKIDVTLGQRVYGGQTVLGRWLC